MLQVKHVDTKGRITLGRNYANRVVIVNQNKDGELFIKPAEVIPAREVWLHKNKAALSSLEKGIEEARQGKFAKDKPDIYEEI